MTEDSQNSAVRRSQNGVYQAGRRGAAWSASESTRAQSGAMLTGRRDAPLPTKPLRFSKLKTA